MSKPGDVTRRYLRLIEQLDEDSVMEDLARLRALPFDGAEAAYNDAVNDYISALLSGDWE